MNYIDIHGHVNFPEYDKDREEAIKRAQDAGVGMITVGTDIESSKRAIELAETHENMWAVVGIHPTEVDTEKVGRNEDEADFQELRKLALHPKVVAIGECGLDYFHSDEKDIPAQIEAFEKHIAIANEANKPLMLHVRNANAPRRAEVFFAHGAERPSEKELVRDGKGHNEVRNAYQDALSILKKSSKVPANFHFFAGTLEDMKAAFEAGCTVSFTGVLTFTKDYDALIKAAPLEKIMTETDCPYVAPAPHRGKRNEPTFVIEVVKAIARIRGEDEEAVRKRLLENAKRFFDIL